MEYNIPQIHLRNNRPGAEAQFSVPQNQYPQSMMYPQMMNPPPMDDYTNRQPSRNPPLPYQNPPVQQQQQQQQQQQPPPQQQYYPPEQPSMDQTQLMNVPQPNQSQFGNDRKSEDSTESIKAAATPLNQTMADGGPKKALQIVIHGIKQHVARSHLKITCALYEEDQMVVDDLGEKCVFHTTTHNPFDTRKDVSVAPGSTKMSNKAHRQDIIFKEDHVFMKDLNRMIERNFGKKDYYLMFQVLEKPEPTKIQTNAEGISYKASETDANFGGREYDLFGWFLFKLNKAQGGVNVGKFVRKMFEPDLRKPPLDMTKVVQMESDIEFAINEVDWDQDESKVHKKKKKPGKGDKSILGKSINK